MHFAIHSFASVMGVICFGKGRLVGKGKPTGQPKPFLGFPDKPQHIAGPQGSCVVLVKFPSVAKHADHCVFILNYDRYTRAKGQTVPKNKQSLKRGFASSATCGRLHFTSKVHLASHPRVLVKELRVLILKDLPDTFSASTPL